MNEKIAIPDKITYNTVLTGEGDNTLSFNYDLTHMDGKKAFEPERSDFDHSDIGMGSLALKYANIGVVVTASSTPGDLNASISIEGTLPSLSSDKTFIYLFIVVAVAYLGYIYYSKKSKVSDQGVVDIDPAYVVIE